MTRILSTEELVLLQQGPGVFAFLNVMPIEQYAQHHIPGSVCAPIDSVQFIRFVEARTGGDTEMRVVVYGFGNSCDASARAARKLESAGYTNVLEYSGGMATWMADRPQVRPSQEEMAAISAAVRAGEARSARVGPDSDDEQERDLAGSERDAERENWSWLRRQAPKPWSSSAGDPSARRRLEDFDDWSVRRAAY